MAAYFNIWQLKWHRSMFLGRDKVLDKVHACKNSCFEVVNLFNVCANQLLPNRSVLGDTICTACEQSYPKNSPLTRYYHGLPVSHTVCIKARARPTCDMPQPSTAIIRSMKSCRWSSRCASQPAVNTGNNRQDSAVLP